MTRPANAPANIPGRVLWGGGGGGGGAISASFVCFFSLTEVIPTSPDCAALPRSHPDVRGEAKVGPGSRGSRADEGGRGALRVYSRVFWVAFSLRVGQTRASFPRNTGVSTCGAARAELRLLPHYYYCRRCSRFRALQERDDPICTRLQGGVAGPLLALPVARDFRATQAQPGSAPVVALRRGSREAGLTLAASYSEAPAAFTAQTELGINSYFRINCARNFFFTLFLVI